MNESMQMFKTRQFFWKSNFFFAMENYFLEREAQIQKVNVNLYNNLFYLQKGRIQEWIQRVHLGVEESEVDICNDLLPVTDLFIDYLKKELPGYEFKRKSELEKHNGTILVHQKYTSPEEYVVCCLRAKMSVIHGKKAKFTKKEIDEYLNRLFDSMESVGNGIAKNQYFTIHRVRYYISDKVFEWMWNISYQSDVLIAMERHVKSQKETTQKEAHSSNSDTEFVPVQESQ